MRQNKHHNEGARIADYREVHDIDEVGDEDRAIQRGNASVIQSSFSQFSLTQSILSRLES